MAMSGRARTGDGMMTGMGLFGSDEKEKAESAALAAELERLQATSLPAVAEEIMTRTWGHGGPADAYANATTAIDYDEIEKLFNPTDQIFGVDLSPLLGITEILEEALQLLEHARLVVMRVSGSDHVSVHWRATRAGLAALEAGEVRARVEALPD